MSNSTSKGEPLLLTSESIMATRNSGLELGLYWELCCISGESVIVPYTLCVVGKLFVPYCGADVEMPALAKASAILRETLSGSSHYLGGFRIA